MPTRKPRGRPRLDPNGPSAQTCVRMSASTYDQVYAIASERGMDTGALIREWIEMGILSERRAAGSRVS